LNRWREEQINAGKKITYGDLVNHYIELSEKDGPFERIAHGRYINFIADFQKHEPAATRADALKSWDILKKLEIPKNYQSLKIYNKKTKRTQNVRSKRKS
jgi:hypothetical protein